MEGLVWTGVIPFLAESPGQGFFFKFKDRDYRVECWYTRHSSGTDFYREDGESVESVEPFTDEEYQEFEPELEKIQQVWNTKFADWVRPALDKAHLATLVAMGTRVETGSPESVEHYENHGRYLLVGEETA